jgi:predicted nucleotidyltransferase
MDKQILNRIKQLRQEILPDDKMILFGSQARGDAQEKSDWDLLILLNKPVRAMDDYDNYAYPFAELGWTYGKYFSVKIFTVSEWEKQKPSLFYKNVEREGIEII